MNIFLNIVFFSKPHAIHTSEGTLLFIFRFLGHVKSIVLIRNLQRVERRQIEYTS